MSVSVLSAARALFISASPPENSPSPMKEKERCKHGPVHQAGFIQNFFSQVLRRLSAIAVPFQFVLPIVGLAIL